MKFVLRPAIVRFIVRPLLRSLQVASLVLSAAAILGVATARAATGDEEITAVSSRVSEDYMRSKLPNGSFQPETYAFGQGGYWSGAMSDKSIDGSKFMEVAHVIAGPLQQQSYLPTKDAHTTKLLIMVYWGTTRPPPRANETAEFQNAARAFDTLHQSILTKGGSGPPNASGSIKAMTGQVRGGDDEENAFTAAMSAMQAQNAIRRRLDAQNSRLLGYDSWWDSTSHLEGTPLDTRRQDMLIELEEDRYFVVLMAYDFQLMWKQKKAKLLWETRFSINQRHHEFDQDLPAIAAYASKYFGQDTHGLIRKPLSEARVELGELKSLGEEPQKK